MNPTFALFFHGFGLLVNVIACVGMVALFFVQPKVDKSDIRWLYFALAFYAAAGALGAVAELIKL